MLADTFPMPGEAANGDSWRLRAARPDDAEVCAALAVVAWQRVHDAYVAILGADMHRRLFANWQEAKARDVGGLVREHPERALVAEADSAIVAFATFRQDLERHIGVIGNNAVHPAWQGRGIAGALYQAVLAQMRINGIRLVQVTTGLDEGHAPARAAYQKAGFTVGLPSITYYQALDGADDA
ncbi:MAG TPA: GNAT family N-acetyltransferase [Chloroflexota bacterium]|jgi:ribosomal protein S18 acetylase RimI-like enzyme|nr:GNAT family N-acetyltransferase [Chloroflexota bacterium]